MQIVARTTLTMKSISLYIHKFIIKTFIIVPRQAWYLSENYALLEGKGFCFCFCFCFLFLQLENIVQYVVPSSCRLIINVYNPSQITSLRMFGTLKDESLSKIIFASCNMSKMASTHCQKYMMPPFWQKLKIIIFKFC